MKLFEKFNEWCPPMLQVLLAPIAFALFVVAALVVPNRYWPEWIRL